MPLVSKRRSTPNRAEPEPGRGRRKTRQYGEALGMQSPENCARTWPSRRFDPNQSDPPRISDPSAEPSTHVCLRAGSTWPRCACAEPAPCPASAFQCGGAEDGPLREHFSSFCIRPLPNRKVGPGFRDRVQEFRGWAKALGKALHWQCAGARCVSRDLQLPGNGQPAVSSLS